MTQDADTLLNKQLFTAARNGDTAALTSLLDAHPDKIGVRDEPYEWSLLHAAAEKDISMQLTCC